MKRIFVVLILSAAAALLCVGAALLLFRNNDRSQLEIHALDAYTLAPVTADIVLP